MKVFIILGLVLLCGPVQADECWNLCFDNKQKFMKHDTAIGDWCNGYCFAKDEKDSNTSNHAARSVEDSKRAEYIKKCDEELLRMGWQSYGNDTSAQRAIAYCLRASLEDKQ